MKNDDDDESGERKGDRGKKKEERRRSKGKEENTDMDPKHARSCANHSQDLNRFPVPRSKQVPSRRFQV